MLRLFTRKKKKPAVVIQQEYLSAISNIMSSPLWNGSPEMIKDHLPKDLNDDTINYAMEKFKEQ